MQKLIMWLLKLPPLAGYRSYIGFAILAATGIVMGLQVAIGYLAGPEAAATVAAIPILEQVLGWKEWLAGAGAWLVAVGAAFNNESPRAATSK